MKGEYYAHSREGKPPKDWHRLEDHLKRVAEMARAFAEDFDAGDWGYLAGPWHDLQEVLLGISGKTSCHQRSRCPYRNQARPPRSLHSHHPQGVL